MPKGKYTPFTPAQEQFIKDNYLSIAVKPLGQLVGASFGRITNFLQKHNLVIPPEIVQQRRHSQRFKKGTISHNKGKKLHEFMSPESIERFKKNQFKKGHTPHNNAYNGKIVTKLDGYKYIRIARGNWQLLHRVIWEQHHGPIPPDNILTFKDGNPANITLENLQLSCRIENMLLNCKYKNPAELIPSLVLVNKLKTKLKTLNHGK